MAPGRKRLQKLQLGIESTAGTAVAATTIWRGMGNMLEDQRVIEEIEEMVGVIEGYDRTAIPQYLGGLELAETPLTFEQFQYILAGAFGATTGGAADGSGSGKVYTTTLPTTAAPTLKSYTWQGGDDFEAERMEYGVVTKWSVKGTGGETSKVTATIMGRQVTTNAFTGSLAVPTVEDVLTSKGKVWLDAISGTFGTTQVANQILAYEINCEALWIPKFTMDGQLYFSLPVFAGYKMTGKLTFEHDTAVSGTGGAKADWRNQTAKKLRVNLIGGALTTAGTTYSTKVINFDLPIKWTKANVIEDKDGNDIVDMEFRSRYNSTAGTAGSIVVVNENSSLT